jgi:hypothetical protein
MKHSFGVEVCTERKTGEMLAVYFQVREGKAAQVKEFADGTVFANYARNGELLGIEMLAPCEIKVLDKIAASEDPKYRNQTRDFFRNSVPRNMVREQFLAGSKS